MARACIVRQYHYPLDPRVRREAEALEALGHEVDVICLRAPGECPRERFGRVSVYRVPLAHRRGGPFRYVYEYASFLVVAAAIVTALHLRRRYDVVQVNSMPDVLVFAALVPRLTGARIALDLHECMPEFFATKYGLSISHPGVRVVALAEQASICFAHRVLTCTEQMREAFIARGAPAEKIGVVLNAADTALFDRARFPPAPRDAERLRLICHGSVEPLYGLDTVIRAVALLRSEGADVTLAIYGAGTQVRALRDLAGQLDLDGAVRFSRGFVPIEELLQALSEADAGVVAMRSDPFRDLVHCHKMYDYLALGKPVICSRTRSVQEYFGEDCFEFFTASDEHDLARAIRLLYEDPERGRRMVVRTDEVSEPYGWQHQRRIYQEIVDAPIRV